MNEKLKILFVDDEITLLESLRRATRSMRKEWDCEFVSSGKEALRIFVCRQMNVDQSCKFLRDTYLPEGVFL